MADPTLGLKIKLEADASGLPADVRKAQAQVASITGGAAALRGAAGGTGGDGPLAMPDSVETYSQFLIRKKIAADKARQEEREAIKAENEAIRAEYEKFNQGIAEDIAQANAQRRREERRRAKEEAAAAAAAEEAEQLASLERKQKRAEARDAEARARAERAAVRDIGRETGGVTSGQINQRTAAFARMDDSLKGIHKRFSEGAQAAMRFVGSASLIGGTAAAFYTAGNAIYEGIVKYLETGRESAQKFKESLDLSDVKGSLAAYASDLADLDAAMAERSAGTLRGWAASIFKSDDKLQEEITQKRKDRDALAAVDKARKESIAREEEKKKAAEQAKQIAEQKQRAEIERRQKEKADGEAFAKDAFDTEQSSLMTVVDERTRIIAEAAAKKRELEQRYNSLGLKEAIANEDLYKRARDAINLERDKQLREYDKQNEESANRVRQVWTDAFKAIREESNRAFSSDQAASMVQFAQQMRFENITAAANMNRIVVEGVG